MHTLRKFCFKKAFWKAFVSFHPLTPSHLHQKTYTRPQQKQPEREFKCQLMNLRTSEVVYLFPFQFSGWCPSSVCSYHPVRERRHDDIIWYCSRTSFSLSSLREPLPKKIHSCNNLPVLPPLMMLLQTLYRLGVTQITFCGSHLSTEHPQRHLPLSSPKSHLSLC